MRSCGGHDVVQASYPRITHQKRMGNENERRDIEQKGAAMGT